MHPYFDHRYDKEDSFSLFCTQLWHFLVSGGVAFPSRKCVRHELSKPVHSQPYRVSAMSSEGPITQWAEITLLLSVAASVYLLLLLLACVCQFLNIPVTGQDDLTDIRIALLALRDSKLFLLVKKINDGYSIDAACVRIFPSIAVCAVYVYNTYYQFISPTAHILLASFGLFTLTTIILQIPIEALPIRYVTQFEFIAEVLSCTSLIVCRGSTWLNFSFFQAHIVLTRFLEVLPTLTALFWKKPQPQVQQNIRFFAIFTVHVYIFASGLQLFERLGDPFLVFRSTALELTLWNSLYFTFVTVFTVGYGDFIPYTLLGRFWMVLVIMVGVLLVSYKIAKFHELSHAFWSGQGSFVKRDGVRHALICGNIKWEYLKAFVCEFFSDVENQKHQLVVMSDDISWTDQERAQIFTPYTVYKQQVSFYRGSCMSEEDLKRAKVESAEAVFVLNNQHNPNVYVEDSETLKRILTIRSYAPDVPIYSMCALTDSMFQIGYALEHASIDDTESMSSEHSLLGDDHCDGMVVLNFEGPSPKSEAICMQDLEMSMLAGNVYCNGMSTLLSNLLLLTRPTNKEEDQEQPWMLEYKAGTENNLRFVKIPSNMDEVTYREIALTLYDRGVILLATKKYFDNVWKPVTPDTKFSHSSIGLALTFLARIDLSKNLENIANMVEAETTMNSETDQSVPVDELSYRTPSYYEHFERAGRHLAGDGPGLILDNEFNELGEYDEIDELNRDIDEAGADADDELDDIIEEDDEFFSDARDSSETPSAIPSLPFYSSRSSAQDLRDENLPLHMPPAFTDGAITPNDNPEEFSRADGGESDSHDETLLGKDHDADLDISGVHVVDSREATDNDTTGPSEGGPSNLHRSVLRHPTMDDGPPSKGSDGARVKFEKFSSIHEFRTQWAGDQRTSMDSPDRRRHGFFSRLKRGTTFPSRPASSEQLMRRPDSTGTELRAGSRSISIQELPQVHVDAEEDLNNSLNLDDLPSLSGLATSLGDFEDSKGNSLEPDTQVQSGNIAEDDDGEGVLDNDALQKASYVETKFDGSGGSSSASGNVKSRAVLAKQSIRFRKNRDHDDGSSGYLYPGQRSDSGMSEKNSIDRECGVEVCYGDMPLPEKYRNHILVCVIGQMGMMNLKPFLLRLRAARRGFFLQDQHVVAICPVVTDENVQELSELDSLKLCLIQGNSLSINILQIAQYHKARSIMILACEDKGVVNHMDSNAIYTIMTLDHLIPENANIFVCSMIDSEESMHLLRAPNRERTRIGDLATEADYRMRRRNSRNSMRNFAAMGLSFDSQYGSMRSALPLSMTSGRLSAYDLSRVNSFDARGRRTALGHIGALRQSRSFVGGPDGGGRRDNFGRLVPHSDTFEDLAHRLPTASVDYHDFDFYRKQQSFGGATLLRRLSTATLNNSAWMGRTLSNVQSTGIPHPNSGKPSMVVQKSRDAAFEKERYASGEMMISSMFIALLIRELSMPGLTDVVGTLFGTRLETQPCWVRSLPIPKSWIPDDPEKKGLEYRDLCEHLLERSCIPIGLYRCGAAPVRVWYNVADEEDTVEDADEVEDVLNDEEMFIKSPDMSSVADRVSALSRLRTLSPANTADQANTPDKGSASKAGRGVSFLDGINAHQYHDEIMPEGLDSSPSGFSEDSHLEPGSSNEGEYKFVTSDRTVRYFEHPSGLNMLPYVYTNPEPYTIVSEHDAVYVLVDPALNLKELK